MHRRRRASTYPPVEFSSRETTTCAAPAGAFGRRGRHGCDGSGWIQGGAAALDPGWIVCILAAKYCTWISTYVWSQRGVTIDGTRHSSTGGVAFPWPARLHRHRAGSCRRPRWLERLFALFARRRSPRRIYVNYSSAGVVWYGTTVSIPPSAPGLWWFVVV